MKFSLKKLILFGAVLSLLSACGSLSNNTVAKTPAIILWAWEREEDLRFADAGKIGVAFLAQTLTLQNGEVSIKPRRQPLQVAENAYLIAVTRIESDRKQPPALSEDQMNQTVDQILKTLQKKNVKALQIDFDAVVSERDFYRKLLTTLRSKMDAQMPLSITALASFCIGDKWYGDLPVNDAVPMIFRMGADAEKVRKFIASGADFSEPLCRNSYGLSLDEPLGAEPKSGRTIYFFNNRSWKESDLKTIYEIAKQ